MLRSRAIIQSLGFLCLVLGGLPSPAVGRKVDFEYKPALWNTSINLPDDWQKTLVNQAGDALYDYPGPNQGFKTVISAGIVGATMKPVDQHLLDAKTPIVMTTSEAHGVTLKQEAFAIVDSPFKPVDPNAPKPRLYRVGRELTKSEWATPPASADPAFQNIAIGDSQPIRYQYNVEPGSSRTVAVGLIEALWKVAGKRPLIVSVEGAPLRTIDIAAVAGFNKPYVALFDARDVDGDGHIDIEIRPIASAPDRDTVLSALWVFPQGEHPAATKIITGSMNTAAEAFIRCGEDPETHTFATRRDVYHLDYSGASAFHPVLRLQSTRKVAFNKATGLISLDGHPFLTTQPAPLAAKTKNGKTLLVYAGGVSHIDVVVVTGPDRPLTAFRALDFGHEHDRTVAYWKNLDLPYDRVHVPDTGVQALIDSSVRNIFQARDIRGGKPEFRTGPTMYRDIWIVDGSFLLEMATELGVVNDSRRAIDRILEYQQPSGQIIVLQPNFYKETGIVLWMLEHHARLTQDKPWLEERWKHVVDGVRWMKAIRKEASANPLAPYAGLIPPGHSDGGIGGPKAANSEYTNIYWTLAGLKSSIDAARWLGHSAEVADWQAEYDDFFATFQRAAARDMKTDALGNRYLPILMNPKADDLPQKAQWGFCQAIFPGQVLAPDDPIATGTLSMLDGVSSEGLVMSTGWMTGGIWTYFGSFYAHAHLWLGGEDHTRKAQDILYAFANHASPLLVWREEQRPVGKGTDTIGDMPHNWASAEFIRLVRHMIALERGADLTLFSGVPVEWLRPGDEIHLSNVATEFGPLTVRAAMSADGHTEALSLSPIGTPGEPGAPIISLGVFKQAGFRAADGRPLPDHVTGAWGQSFTMTLVR